MCPNYYNMPSRSTSARATRGSGQRLDLDDPLDAAGARPNPLTGGPYSEDRARWARTWQKFPLYSEKPKLRELAASFSRNRVTIVVSGTGSGKTVLAVPLMLRVVSARPGAGAGASVAVTIPKRTTVLAAARTGAMTLDVPLGRQVGYQFRGAPAGSYGDSTRLLYATDGTLLAYSRREPLMSRFDAVVVDEAHERPLPTDLLLVALKAALARRPEMRLAVMSATIDPAEFVRYFRAAGLSVGVVQVAGSPMHSIERRFLGPPRPGKTHLEAGLEVARGVLADGRRKGNVILFVPLTRDAVDGCKPAKANADCVPIYGKMSSDERAVAVAPRASRRGRQLFVATNVAESSLTIPDLLDVVDTGMQLVSEYDARTHGTRVAKEMATQAQITQRIGRAGRTAPGVAHLLYTRAQLDARPLFPKPAILSADMSQTLLEEMVSDGSRGPAWFLSSLITPPTVDQLADAAMTLHFYGLINVRAKSDDSPTTANVPFSKMAYATQRYSAGADASTVSAQLAWALNSHDYAPSHFGKVTAAVMERMKIGLPQALLLAAGVACGCAVQAARLALLIESTGGDLRSLWLDSEDAKPPRVPKGCEGSDHAALAAMLEQILNDPDTSAGALARLGLSPGPWLAARDVVQSQSRQLEALGRPDTGLARAVMATCPASFRGKGLLAAVAAARALNTARMDRGGRVAITVHALRAVQADVRPMMPGSAYGHRIVVFEQLTLGAGSAKLSGVSAIP